jgi:hypothetical protein
MRTRPFLSHRRTDRKQVVELKRVLALYGTGGWRDLDDLDLGELGQPGFEKAIDEVTGGFLWYGTKRVLASWYVNNVELPAAIARKRREPDYPLVPLFATVPPGEARAALLAATKKPSARLTANDHALFFEANGYSREARERVAEFRASVAKRYIRSAVKWLDTAAYSVAITALTEPSGGQDFTFDWRGLLDPQTRVLAGGAQTTMCDAVTGFRDAIKPTAEFPHVTIDFDAPLPIAALVGYEWRVTSRMKLTIRQRTRSGIFVVDGDGPAQTGWPGWVEKRLGGTGPSVVAVSTTDASLAAPLQRYAAAVDAAFTLELHVPGELDGSALRGLARHTAAALRNLQSAQRPKHLLLAGPCALAALVGAGANAGGPVTAPIWNGVSYGSTLVFGC